MMVPFYTSFWEKSTEEAAIARADRFTELSIRPVRYADFSSGFELNPITGDLALVTDVESVKQSVRNAILTQKGERPFQPTFGCKVHDLLFDMIDSVTIDLIHETIDQTITFHEPRASLVSVDVAETGEDALTLTITFGVINIPEPVTLSVLLKRVS